MGYRGWKKNRYRWKERISDKVQRREASSLPFIRAISKFALHVPLKGFPGLLVALLPFALAVGLFWRSWPNFLALALAVAAGIALLRWLR